MFLSVLFIIIYVAELQRRPEIMKENRALKLHCYISPPDGFILTYILLNLLQDCHINNLYFDINIQLQLLYYSETIQK